MPSQTNLVRMVVLLLSALVAITLLKPLIGIPLRVNKNYNEGWNAYQVLRLLGDEPLYPNADASTPNNYPPLSFYLVAYRIEGRSAAPPDGRSVQGASTLQE